MGAAVAQSRRSCLIVRWSMTPVPWWFQTLAQVLAIVFSIWLGLHIHADRAPLWMALYGAAALLTALLPSKRVVGFVGLGIAVAVGGLGGYLMKDALGHLAMEDAISTTGPILNTARETIVLGLAAVWLLVGSAFRTRRA
jgi:hypothetical protein